MDKIISVDFSKTGEHRLEKARTAVERGNLFKALESYRNVLESEPFNFEAGLEYAILLYQNGCWLSSMKECYRLLCCYPKEEKLYGLMYRNFMELGQEDDARFAYERYMLYLYHNPDGGLNLGESDPLIPSKPPRKRYNRLLGRAMSKMFKGDLEGANKLLMHANHPIFPHLDTLRTVLEVSLMQMMGMEEEARETVHNLLESREMNASEALGLMPMMYDMDSPAYAGNLLLYAATEAHNKREVFDTLYYCMLYQQFSLGEAVIQRRLEDSPYRLDLVYDLAVFSLYQQDMSNALDLIKLCHKLDPHDADVDFLYRILTEAAAEKIPPNRLMHLPIYIYGSANIGRFHSGIVYFREVVSRMPPEEQRKYVLNYANQTRLLGLLFMMEPEQKETLLSIISTMDKDDRIRWLRMYLLFSSPDDETIQRLTGDLHELGVTGEIPLVDKGVLTTITVE